MAGSFSLPRLPQKELSTVLLCMTSIDRLSYSLCSNKCKKLLTDLNLKALELHVWFSNDFEIYWEFDDEDAVMLTTSPENNQNVVLNLDVQRDLAVAPPFEITSWNYNGLSCYEWLAHCMEIYHIEIINRVEFYSGNYILDQARKVLELPQIQIIMIDSLVGAEFAHGILSLNLQCKQVSIAVDSFGRTNRFGSIESLRKAMIQNVDNNRTVSWIYKCLSCREWLAHCMEIFHTVSCESAILYSTAENMCFEQIRYMLEKLQTRLIRINSDERVELVHKILPLHLQCKEISINMNSFGRAGSMENCRKAVIQNTDNVCFEGSLDEANLHWKLDDLLLTNASQLALIAPKLFNKDVNRFLKLWMSGTNRRLKTLKLIIVNEPFFNEEEIMRGIHHTTISEQDFDEKMRAHNYPRNFMEMMNGGFNIISRDGREASIGLTRVFETSMVQFFVWN